MRETPPDYKKLLESGVVSEPYANQIVNGRRSPSLGKALEIYDATGLKFGKISGATAREIEALRRVIGSAA